MPLPPADLSAIPLHLSRLIFSLFVLALGALMLPATTQNSCAPSTAISTPAGTQNGTTAGASPWPGTITVPETVTEVQVKLTGVKVTDYGSSEALYAAQALLVSPTCTVFVSWAASPSVKLSAPTGTRRTSGAHLLYKESL